MRISRSLRRLVRGGWGQLLVGLGLGAFVLGVYVVVVVVGGSLIGRTDSPSAALSVLATTAVALLFAPVQGFLERQVARHGHSVESPYDVLSRFSETTISGDVNDQLPARMARLLAGGTGATWAQVWLDVSGSLTLAATWPEHHNAAEEPPEPGGDARDRTGEGRRALTVRQGDQELGVLRLQERPGLPLTVVEERLFTGLAAQAGLVLSQVRLRAELESRREDLLDRSEQLHASRQRLVATHDDERRRLERDMHDGAQQHLVALAVNLRLAETVVARSPERAVLVLANQAGAARAAMETLSSLSRGIYPRLLSDAGLVPALRLALAASAIPVAVEAEGSRRPEAVVEAALYFCCLEAVQNATKHSGAAQVTVRVTEVQDAWLLSVIDDGVGIDASRQGYEGGAGMANMRDRLDSVGGTLVVGTRPGGGTTVTATVAAPDQRGAVPA